MILATIFDLDGTLIDTERLKALSYARAAVELNPQGIKEAEVIEAFQDVVGLSRQEVATTLVARFNLEELSRRRMAEFAVSTPWEAFVGIRMRYYGELLADIPMLKASQWPHNIQLLRETRACGCGKLALATMSYRPEVLRILFALEITDEFDLILTREDVKKGKPDPEIYLLAAEKLDIPANECLVVEDSANGVQAAVAAHMAVVAVSTPLTRAGLHQSGLLPPNHIVDDPSQLPRVVVHVILHHESDQHD